MAYALSNRRFRMGDCMKTLYIHPETVMEVWNEYTKLKERFPDSRNQTLVRLAYQYVRVKAMADTAMLKEGCGL